MDNKTFGTLALQLLEGAQIPGAHVDTACAFKRQAEALARGEVDFAADETGADPRDVSEAG
ncbi:hypothetical protein [Paracoccus shanxieyensis]|uniref:Uncharacterized protein n=1 Tax=Paracoccus shanxieyensis TaxID=2675752 RepID=A0A6L6J1D0_9RHOB|nr:hypothetical protein [Paracoccus shanxieyensis]MTH65080.1 hypothetical protein [Paracoccus shanxieyensis]MTH88224.1 hypothetical protein [Paracoccus shanxieyensis]